MATINLIDGEKGGVGKSWIARTMIQYLTDNQIPFTSVEADRSNPTVKNIYVDSKFAFFSENQKTADIPDSIFDYAIKNTVVVNLPAQCHVAVSQWIESKGLFELGKGHDVSFIKWFITNGEKDSIELFIKSLEHYKGQIPHVLIKNYGLCDEWEFFELHEQIQKAIAEYKVSVINIPKLSDGKRIEINAKNLTFDAATKHESFGIIGRNQVLTYLRNAYKEFDSTGLLPKAQPPVVKKA